MGTDVTLCCGFTIQDPLQAGEAHVTWYRSHGSRNDFGNLQLLGVRNYCFFLNKYFCNEFDGKRLTKYCCGWTS